MTAGFSSPRIAMPRQESLRRADRRRRVDVERGDAEGGGEGESRTDEERDECDDRGDE
jgi:hypothetical protein